MVRAIFTQNGFGYDYPLRMKGWLEDAGLEDLKQEVIDVPLGALNPNPEMAEKSTWQATSAVKGIMPVARGLCLLLSLSSLFYRKVNLEVFRLTA